MIDFNLKFTILGTDSGPFKSSSQLFARERGWVDSLGANRRGVHLGARKTQNVLAGNLKETRDMLMLYLRITANRFSRL